MEVIVILTTYTSWGWSSKWALKYQLVSSFIVFRNDIWEMGYHSHIPGEFSKWAYRWGSTAWATSRASRGGDSEKLEFRTYEQWQYPGCLGYIGDTTQLYFHFQIEWNVFFEFQIHPGHIGGWWLGGWWLGGWFCGERLRYLLTPQYPATPFSYPGTFVDDHPESTCLVGYI